ncbi:uncharacterized protein LOC130771292 isoform X1 [Actinidia eriantha]|uniref:uncharacterized protein LOC130771292 isoform X1 n=1 Tax=Actinidia eriantha TaxID=165200 RepID=UPI0025861EDF|nr:uncharacterized protein LOC130771292 isoform X1 [Actinidia eriantha]
MGTSNVSLLHAVKKNLDVGLTSTTREFESVDNLMNSAEVRIPTLQTSNPAVRAILEHLDRNTPTSKEKSAELQVATEWKKSLSSKVTNAMPKEGTSLKHLEAFDYHKNTNFSDKELSVKENDGENSNFEDRRQMKSTSEATDVTKHTETSSKLNGSHSSQIKFTNETASFGFTDSREKGTNQLWPLPNQIKGQGTTNMPFNSTGSESLKKNPISAFRNRANSGFNFCR